MTQRVVVGIVTYNSAACLPIFLESLRKQNSVSWEALFFDNASRDDTQDLIREAALGELFVSDSNTGYGRGHNHNLERCRGAYVLLLNPDLQFGPELFSRLLRYLEEHPEYCLVGPRIVEGPERRPFPPRYFYPGEGMIPLEPELRRRDIAWISGCCLMIRRETFARLGGFDPDYFLYQEETDLCLRARRAGYRIGHVDDAVVHHLHRQSQRELSEYEYAHRIFQGSAIFWNKHYPAEVLDMVRFQYWMSRLLLTFGRARAWLPDLGHVLGEARLRARNDVCRQWLDKRSRRRIGFSRHSARIALRQCRLLIERIRQGRFPLDDY